MEGSIITKVDNGQLLASGYRRASDGTIWQENVGALQTYDAEYVRTRYDVIDCRPMSQLRYEWLTRHAQCNLPRHFRMLDFGCGNGAFIKWAMADRKYAPVCFGYDISRYPLEGVDLVDYFGVRAAYDVVTFFDSLEHTIDPYQIIRVLKCNHVMISVPWCHFDTQGWKWFENWKHRRPNEHLWHWSSASLCAFMQDNGYTQVVVGNPEDEIRKPGEDGLPNILTGLFLRTHAPK